MLLSEKKSLYIYRKIISSKLFHKLPDEVYLKILYRLRIGKKLNLSKPKTFNEKLQWLKINDRKPIYSKLVDKYEVREYIKNKIGEDYLIPIIGVYSSIDEIDFDSLPNKFVLKTTHDSGGVFICRDKNNFDFDSAKNKLRENMNKNVFYEKREWPYKNVKPRIICETYMVDESGTDLKDYKFFSFNGKVKMMFIASERSKATKFDFYDMNFNRLPVEQHYPNSSKNISKPQSFEKMVDLAEKLSKDFPHLRVDLYDINGKIYFGELTFYHFSGFEKFEPEKYDLILGNHLHLQD